MKKSKTTSFYVLIIFLFTSCFPRTSQDTTEEKSVQEEQEIVQDTTKQVEQAIPIKEDYQYIDTIKGDFNGDREKEYVYSIVIVNEDKGVIIDDEKYNYITFSNSSIPPIETEYLISHLTNEGDLNGDGTDEIGFLIGSISNWQTYNVYSLRNNKWKIIVSETVFAPDINDKTELVKIHPKKKGYLLIQTTDWIENDTFSGNMTVEKLVKIE